MIRLVALVAAVAFAATTTANASQVRVSLVGKSHEQIAADLKIAARTVCAKENSAQPLMAGAYSACVRATLRAAVAQLPA
jgi:hypothetical protein